MDARQRLRRYLEQRRDLGESELVLDSMTVEEVLHAIGARHLATTERPLPETTLVHERQNAGWRAELADHLTADQVPPPLSPGTGDDGVVAGASIPVDVDGESLATVAVEVESCTRCPLYKTATRGVPGDGPSNARLVCVGEAPGANEDLTGHPFVGAAGNLLTKILAAVDLGRDQVFITNVVKHRPPGNRNPAPGEIEACNPYLVRQLDLIKPKVIVAFGTFAAQTLLNSKTPIGKLRGEVHRYHGIPLIVTYHPAALLRNPAWKRPTWEDVKLARRILDSAAGT